MKNLLEYTIPSYEYGDSVDFDPYENTNLADSLAKMNIEVDSQAMGLLPTYDPMGATLARTSYEYGQDANLQAGQKAMEDTTSQFRERRGATGLTMGADIAALTDVRGDVSRGFGQKAREDYLSLQEDVYNINQGYDRDLQSGISDLDPDSWSFVEQDDDEVYGVTSDKVGGSGQPPTSEGICDTGFYECQGVCIQIGIPCE